MSKKRILIVEDERVIAVSMRKRLENWGYDVVAMVSSGEECIDIVEKSPPDLILMDITLDGNIDGIDTAETIRSFADVPVIFITGFDEADVLQRAKTAAPYAYLRKPVNMIELGNTVDIALFKSQADRKIRESEERFRGIFDNASVGIDMTDRDKRYILVNSALADMLGYTPEEMLRGAFIDFTHPDDVALSVDRYRDLVEGRTDSYRIEKRYIRKDGSVVWIDLSVSAIRDSAGVHTGTMGVIVDITDRKRAEEALRESEERYRKIVETANEGIWVIDTEGTTTFINNQMAEMLGTSVLEIMDASLFDFMEEGSVSSAQELLKRRFEGVTERHDFKFRRKDGGELWASVSTNPLYDRNGVPTHALAMVTDVTERKRTEEELRTSREQLRTIFEASPAAIFIVDPEGRITFANQRMGELFARPSEELQGLPYPELVHPDQRSIGLEKMKSLMGGEIDYVSHERRYVTAKGREFLGHLSGRRMTRPDGSLEGLVGIISDITDRREAEEALKESESRFRHLMEDVKGIAAQGYDEERRIIFWNSASERLYGYSKEEALGKRLEDLIIPSDQHEKVVDTVGDWLTKGKRIPAGELSLMRKDGSIVPVYSSHVMVENRRGSKEMFCIDLDLSELKKTEAALKESEERYRLVVENANEAIFIVQDGRLKFFNSQTMRMSGYTEEELRGMSLADLIHPEDRDRVLAMHRKRIEGDKTARSYSFRSVDKDGSVKWVNLNSVSLLWEGRPAGLCCVSDISEMKRAEELALISERLKAVGELAGGVAHNFNNLLQIVLGGSQLALTDLDLGNVTQAKANLEQIVDSAKFGAQTVKRLQDFARVRSDEPGKYTKVFDLSDTVNEAIEMSKPWWKTKPEKDGMSVILNRSIRTGCFVHGNENELFEVTVNLIKNAAEALQNGGEMGIRTAVEDDRIILTVEDTGVGISEEDQKRVFEPFWSTKGPQGTGMGLSSSYGIVRRHGGEITVDSRPGEGAVFTVKLPLSRERPRAKESRPPPAVDFRLNILVVDDMPAMIRQLEGGLTTFGQTVYTASSGAEAVEILREARVDLVVCDLAMPEMNGRQVAEAMLDICRERKTRKPGFIMLTGWGGQNDRDRDLAASGVDLILEKPVDIPKLLEVIENMIDDDLIPQR